MPRLVPQFFPKQSFSDLTAATVPLIQFLTKNHPTIDGPGWHIVEAYDGTNREVPSDPTDLDSFTSGFGWRNDVASVPLNAWIVLQSNRAAGNQFQAYFELDTTSNMHVLLFPDGDWTTGAGTDTNPTIPTKSIGQITSYATSVTDSVDLTGFLASAEYTVIADHSVAIFLFDDTSPTGVNWLYIGEIDYVRGIDTRPYVLHHDDFDVHVDLSGNPTWAMADPLAGDFRLGWWIYLASNQATSQAVQLDDGSTNFLGNRKNTPVGIFLENGATAGFRGILRHVFGGENNAGSSITLDGRSFFLRNDADGSSEGIVFTWDRTTA